MNIRKLEYLLKVVECGSVSEAAKRLYVSQPALSQSISSLEKEYQVQIFERRFSNYELTPEGHIIVEAAKRQILEERNLERRLMDARNNQTGKLTIGLSVSRVRQFLPEVLPEFQLKYPKLELIVNTQSYEGYEDMVINGSLDFAFVMDLLRSEVPENDLLIYEPIFKYYVLLAVPPKHPIAKETNGIFDWRLRPPIDLLRVKDEPFIECTKGSRAYKLMAKVYEAYGFRPKVRVELTNETALLSLVDAGIGFGLCQNHSAFGDNRQRCFFSLDKSCAESMLCFIYRKDTHLTSAMKDFFQIVKKKNASGVWHHADIGTGKI